MIQRLDDVQSLRRSLSSGAWRTIKNRIRDERGARCEHCAAEGERLDAHEVWEYVDAEAAGRAPDVTRILLEEWNARQNRSWARLKSLREKTDKPLTTEVSPFVCDHAVVQALADIQLLCRKCHDRAHVRSEPLGRFLVIGVEYSDFQELSTFKTYKEWADSRRDDAALWNDVEPFCDDDL